MKYTMEYETINGRTKENNKNDVMKNFLSVSKLIIRNMITR
ncbi:hypothetical protein ACT9XH_03885 [Methanococcoides methylutens]